MIRAGERSIRMLNADFGVSTCPSCGMCAALTRKHVGMDATGISIILGPSRRTIVRPSGSSVIAHSIPTCLFAS